jgi:hypothetical protein
MGTVPPLWPFDGVDYITKGPPFGYILKYCIIFVYILYLFRNSYTIYGRRKTFRRPLMEAKDVREQDHSASAQTDTESRIIEAEQTEVAVWESLLEIRTA